MLGTAIAITALAFEGKQDKGGNPYIMHCLNVMGQMPQDDEELMCIAVLHDLVEDNEEWTFERLKDEGFSERVISALRLLTHDKSIPYDNYIKALAGNKDARRVKRAGLKHNSDITRLKGLRASDFERLEKYCRSYVYLSE